MRGKPCVSALAQLPSPTALDSSSIAIVNFWQVDFLHFLLVSREIALTVRAVNNVLGVWLEAALWGGKGVEGGAAL